MLPSADGEGPSLGEGSRHLVHLIRLRNRIAHEYHTFSKRDMEDLIEGLDALEALQPL